MFFSFVIATVCACVTPLAIAGQQSSPSYPERFSVPIEGHVIPAFNSSFEARITFTEAVQLPKIKLPAATYMFRIVSPNVMRVMTEDETKVLATFSTAPITRGPNIDQAIVRFERGPGDARPRVVALFPEDSSVGYQPIYPSLRKQAHAPVAAVATSGAKP
jgi:hypothetical protein